MVECNHWDQWFSDGFGVRQPLVMMVFDGFAPLVRRWNGYVPSLKSTLITLLIIENNNINDYFVTFEKRVTGTAFAILAMFNFCLMLDFFGPLLGQ